MGAFSFVRLSLLGLVWALSIAILGIAANDIALSIGTVWSFPSVALAASVITHALATPMIIISVARKNAATSRVIVELSWVGVLWIVWLLVGVVTTSTPLFSMSCREYGQFFGDEAASECTQFTLLQVLSWLNAAILLSYALLTFSLALVQNMRTKPTDKKTNAFYLDASLLSFRLKPVQPTPSRSKYDMEKTTLALPMPVAFTALSENKNEKERLSSNPHAFWTERLSRTSSMSSNEGYLGAIIAGPISPLRLPSQQLQPPQMSQSPSQRTSQQNYQSRSSTQASPQAHALHPSPHGSQVDRKKGASGRRDHHHRSTSRASTSSMRTTTSVGSGHRPTHVPSPLRKPVPFAASSQASMLNQGSTMLTSEERKYAGKPFDLQRY